MRSNSGVADFASRPYTLRWSRAIRSSVKRSSNRQTDFCVYLSTILLAGLLLNAVLGWWWADPVAALVMVPIIAKEGIDGIKTRTCC